jgi:hypothetical protein
MSMVQSPAGMVIPALAAVAPNAMTAPANCYAIYLYVFIDDFLLLLGSRPLAKWRELF